MQRSFVIFILVGYHILFAFLHIYKQSRILRITYSKQKNECIRDALITQQFALVHQLNVLQNKASLYTTARTVLGMQPIVVNAVKYSAHANNI
jgi:hypothetical protein